MSRGFVGQEFGQGAVGIDCFFSAMSVGRLEDWGWSLNGRLVSCLVGNAGFWLGGRWFTLPPRVVSPGLVSPCDLVWASSQHGRWVQTTGM